jgi:hypothetical protein
MASMSRLEAYLALEREMLRLDAAGDELAEALRDAMDPLWYRLGPDDRKFLNQRTIPPQLNELEPLHGTLVRAEVRLPAAELVDAEAFHSSSWGLAA